MNTAEMGSKEHASEEATLSCTPPRLDYRYLGHLLEMLVASRHRRPREVILITVPWCFFHPVISTDNSKALATLIARRMR